MRLKDNILSKWWFSLVGIPVFILLFSWMMNILLDDNSAVYIYQWFVIIIGSFIGQMILIYRYKLTYKQIHYLYILISANLSMFVTFIFNHSANINDLIYHSVLGKPSDVSSSKATIMENFVITVISTLIVVALLFIFKTITWFSLKKIHLDTYRTRINYETISERSTTLKQENAALKEEIDRLEAKVKDLSFHISGPIIDMVSKTSEIGLKDIHLEDTSSNKIQAVEDSNIDLDLSIVDSEIDEQVPELNDHKRDDRKLEKKIAKEDKDNKGDVEFFDKLKK